MIKVIFSSLLFLCVAFASTDSFAVLSSSISAVSSGVQQNQLITVDVNITGNENYGYFFIDVIFDSTQMQVSAITVHSTEFLSDTVDEANAEQKVHVDYLSLGTGLNTVKVATIEFIPLMPVDSYSPIISGSWQIDSITGNPPVSYTGTYNMQIVIADCMKGDVDGIEGIDVRDVRYLLYHVRGYPGYEVLY